MCQLCVTSAGTTGDLGRRSHVLRLLALVENPNALPPDAALRLSREIMEILRPEAGQRRCESVMPPD